MKRDFRDKLIGLNRDTFDENPERENEVDSNNQYELQIQKRNVMKKLKENLRLIENGEIFEHECKHSWDVSIDSQGNYIAKDIHGNISDLTIGDILTDFRWDLGYILDPETVPNIVRKKYALELAKYRILNYANDQILDEYSGTDDDYAETFKIVKEKIESNNLALGHIAEVFVSNYLKKLSINEKIPINVIDVDIFEDIVDKIDFIFSIKDHYHGVDVEIEENGSKSVAVQFTLKSKKKQVLNKRKIFEDALFDRGLIGDIVIDDGIVLFLHERYVRRAIRRWQHRYLSDKSQVPLPGGPERYFKDSGQRDLLHRLLDDFLGEDYIEEVCKSLGLEKNRKSVKKY